MARFWQTWAEKMRNIWTSRTMAQKVLAGGLLVSVLIAFVLLMFWLNRPQYSLLYSNLSSKDASRIVDLLKKNNVNYKLQDQASSIMVPSGRVHELRLMVAGQDVLQGQGVGLEIFNQNQIGQTEFVQQVNYQRALQGELARTISAMPEVDKARVHLVMPEKSLFMEEQSMSSASVLLDMGAGKELNDKQVQSIVNLVSTAVERLDKNNITITDSAGNLLYKPKEEGGISELSDTQFKIKHELENKLENRIERMLAPIVGPGRILAKVNADLDFSKETINKVLYDPDSPVVRSEQKTSETSRGTTSAETAAQGPEYTGETGTGTGTTQETSRTQKTTNFEINKEEHNIVLPQGQIDRLSTAVIVDGNYEKDQKGEFVFTPRSDQELEKIKELVQSALGYDSARGDQIKVATMPFGKPVEAVEPGIWDKALDYAQRFWKPLLNFIIILLFLLLVVRPVVLAIIRPQVSEEEGEEAEGLPEGEEGRYLEEPVTEEELRAKEAKRHFDDLKKYAMHIIDDNKEEAMDIIRGWMQEEVEA